MEKNIIIENSYEKFSIDKKYDKVLILTDENVYKSQFNLFIDNVNHDSIETYIVKSGEQSKSIETYTEVMEHCLSVNMTRKSLIIAFGGGVIGDLGGFVASTYMRGIDFIQVPTTLLAQVDSSVGGKTAINIGNIKNIIGTFYQPRKTYINVNSLLTLNQEQYLSGIGEVIKYGLIYDYEFIKYIYENSENILNKKQNVLNYITKKCTDIKYDNSDEILEIMKSDKKNSFGNINLVLPIGKGKVGVFDNIEDKDILHIIKRCLDA